MNQRASTDTLVFFGQYSFIKREKHDYKEIQKEIQNKTKYVGVQ